MAKLSEIDFIDGNGRYTHRGSWCMEGADREYCSDNTGPDEQDMYRYWREHGHEYPGDVGAIPDTPESVEQQHILYRMFDDKFRLLYVGMTLDVARRLDQHSCKPWWPDVVHVTLERFESRPELAAAEVRVIKSEKPKHNKQHNA